MKTGLRVLVADTAHNARERFNSMTVWEENGFTAAAFSQNTAETVQLCKSAAVDLVLCCNKPPLLTAPDVMKEVRRAAGEIPFIIISPTDDSEYMRECFLLGAVDYLVEPVDELRIGSALARARKLIKRSAADNEYISAVEEYFAAFDFPDPKDKFIGELKRFILDCKDTVATTEYAADSFGFNKDYFGRMFKARIGMTFVEFYKRFRVHYAERLLATGRYKVRDVSEMLGFASVDYFTGVFKKITGKTPSELKRSR